MRCAVRMSFHSYEGSVAESRSYRALSTVGPCPPCTRSFFTLRHFPAHAHMTFRRRPLVMAYHFRTDHSPLLRGAVGRRRRLREGAGPKKTPCKPLHSGK